MSTATQVSAYISEETKAEVEAYVKRRGVKKAYLIEEALQHHLQALREIPALECSIKEALRLHPPLILLMRKVMRDFEYGGFTVPAGELVGVSPAISNRMPECFPDPDAYHPERYAPDREEDRQLFLAGRWFLSDAEHRWRRMGLLIFR